jgi:hypothetical protein
MITRRRIAAVTLSLVAACTTTTPAGDHDGPPPDDGRRPPDAREPGPDAPDARPDGGPSQLGVYESGARLKMRVGTTPDGAKTFLGWRDTMRNEDCAFLTASDGQPRCLPAAAASYAEDLFWGDAGCTTTRLAYSSGSCPPVTGYARAVSTCQPFRFTIYALGDRHTGPAYVKSGATCTLYTGANEYYVLGAEVAPGSFVAATESLE